MEEAIPKPEPSAKREAVDAAEIRHLKADLAQATEKRDIPKKATAYFAKEAK